MINSSRVLKDQRNKKCLKIMKLDAHSSSCYSLPKEAPGGFVSVCDGSISLLICVFKTAT